MGFTRSTTTTNVHSTLGDYPSVDDGLTPEQLKARFDSPATGLKGDINNLEDELEATTSASYIGAGPIAYSDASSANVQAKLEKIYQDLQEAALGEIPDNSITEAKLTESFSATLAKKNNTIQTNLNADKLDGYHASSFALKNNALQTNLNSEKLGGSTKAQLLAEIASRTSAADTTVTAASSSENTFSIDVHSRFIAFARVVDGSPTGYYFSIFDCRNNNFLLSITDTSSGNANLYLFRTFAPMGGNAEVTNASYSYSTGKLSFTLSATYSSNYPITCKIIQLDGLMP